jgi:hypothetical protein
MNAPITTAGAPALPAAATATATPTPTPSADPSAPRPFALPFAEQFAPFARHECAEDPLYVRLSEAVAAAPQRAALLTAAPPTQARPVLWLAAIQDRLLELAAAGTHPPLAAYYPSLVAAGSGGPAARAPDDALPAALDAFLAAEHDTLQALIATRTTQTNEIGRCAVLSPLLAGLSARAGGRPVALLDVGCSAGLNLGVDRYRYRYLDAAGGAVLADSRPDGPDAIDAPTVDCRLAGDPAHAMHGLDRAVIASRAGIDIAPIDPADEREVRWLRACLWPSDTARRARFDAAVRIARADRRTLRRVADATSAVDDWLATLPPGVLPVVFNSWVLSYFDEAALERHQRHLLRHVAEGRLAWVSAEMAHVMRPAWPGLPAPDAAQVEAAARAGVDARTLAGSTLWTVAQPAQPEQDVPAAGTASGVDWRVAARSHAHGRWAQFAAPGR